MRKGRYGGFLAMLKRCFKAINAAFLCDKTGLFATLTHPSCKQQTKACRAEAERNKPRKFFVYLSKELSLQIEFLRRA
ncbi:MAG: hypothetical protein LUC49_05135 [Prevotella sp.]|nr:hypothetical protein [Prevotella sp.]